MRTEIHTTYSYSHDIYKAKEVGAGSKVVGAVVRILQEEDEESHLRKFRQEQYRQWRKGVMRTMRFTVRRIA